MRIIRKIVVHCSASDHMYDDDFKAIKALHTAPQSEPIQWGNYNTRGKGFMDIGYHYVVTQDGALHLGRNLDDPGAHCKGNNQDSVGVCVTGDKIFTAKQMDTLEKLLLNLKLVFNLKKENIVGHKELDSLKTCPNFNLKTLLEGI